MAVCTSTFGGVTLTDGDAREFLKKINDKRPNQAAQQTAKEGQELLKEYREKGFITVTMSATNTR